MTKPVAPDTNARTLFFNGTRHFEVASGMLRFLKAVAKQDEHHPGTLVPTVFAVLGCEGFINELAEFCADPVLAGRARRRLAVLANAIREAEGSRLSLEAKYALGVLVLTGKPLDRGRQPWQDFILLIALRNALVHLKPELRTSAQDYEAQTYPGMVKRLVVRHLIKEPPQGTPVPWGTIVGTRRVAEWAVETAVAVVRHMLTLLPNGMPRDILSRAYTPSARRRWRAVGVGRLL